MIYWLLVAMYATGVVALTIAYGKYVERAGEPGSHGRVVEIFYGIFLWCLIMIWPISVPICGIILRKVMRRNQ